MEKRGEERTSVTYNGQNILSLRPHYKIKFFYGRKVFFTLLRKEEKCNVCVTNKRLKLYLIDT